jgi:glycosyltransferase involved in cell wall biosynthesis
MELTIGMPVFNGEPFIAEAIESLLSQTYSGFELIISDNASTDQTEAICRHYMARDGRVRYIKHAFNQGPAANFLFVAKQARGSFFMWAAADDKWDPAWIETLLPLARRYDCLAFGAVKQIDDGGSLLSHPANTRKFNFAGMRLYRRVKFLIDNPRRGKANPIYGIMPRKCLDSRCFDALLLPRENSDLLFLYSLLDSVDIRSNPSVFLYKRILSVECAREAFFENVSSAGNSLIFAGIIAARLRSRVSEISKGLNERFLCYRCVRCSLLEASMLNLFAAMYVIRAIIVSVLGFPGFLLSARGLNRAS